MRLPVRQRLIALALAGVYALLAAGGDGLHAISHALFPAGAGVHEACGCGEAGCFFAERERPETSSDETTVHQPAGGQSHDRQECGLCQTLAQLKLAATTLPVVAPHLTTTAPAPIVIEGLSFPTLLTAFDARGPPLLG